MNLAFKTISTVQHDHPESWMDTVYLTLDIDWAHDEILLDSIELIEASGIQATWFVTHETPILEQLKRNSDFELGVHPNFNPLLDGKQAGGTSAQDVLAHVMKIIPTATAIRSHSMTQSSRLLELFHASGLTHDCNHFLPPQAAIGLRPWRHWTGMTKVPYIWEDDLAFHYSRGTSMRALCEAGGIKVFDFHPIHIFLNTDHVDLYESTRALHNRPDDLRKHRSSSPYGAREQLKNLMQLAKP